MRELTYVLFLLVCFKDSESFSLLGADDVISPKELTWPTEYHLRGEELFLNYGTKQTFEIWYSAEIDRSRIDYYGGVSKKYYYGETENYTQLMYAIYPMTTEEETNKVVCLELSGDDEDNKDKAKNFLPSVTNFTVTGTKVVSNRTLQIWERSAIFQSTIKTDITVYAYVHNDVHIPVQIVHKNYNLGKGNVQDHTVTDYYGFESTFDENILDVNSEHDNCEEPQSFNKIFKNDINRLHSGISEDSGFAFQRFKEDYKKEYDGKEHETRKQIFHRNWKLITEHNRKNLGYKLEVNEFTDKTKDELKFLTGTRPSLRYANPNLESDSSKLAQLVDELPEELDLRFEGVITPIKHQAQCGSCWAFSTTAAVEGALARKNGGRLLELSEQSLIDCAWGFGNTGCDGGMVDGAMKYVLEHGIPTDSEYGLYQMENGMCGIRNMSRVYGITGFGQVTPRNVNAMKAALYKYGPVVVGVHASNKMVLYSSGIFYDIDCDGENMNHAVTVVGYGVRDGDTYWIVKNSWGESWGEDGYILISAVNNNCLLLDTAYYPIV